LQPKKHHAKAYQVKQVRNAGRFPNLVGVCSSHDRQIASRGPRTAGNWLHVAQVERCFLTCWSKWQYSQRPWLRRMTNRRNRAGTCFILDRVLHVPWRATSNVR